MSRCSRFVQGIPHRTWVWEENRPGGTEIQAQVASRIGTWAWLKENVAREPIGRHTSVMALNHAEAIEKAKGKWASGSRGRKRPRLSR